MAGSSFIQMDQMLLGIHALVSSTANYVAKQASETLKRCLITRNGAAIFAFGSCRDFFTIGLRMKKNKT